MSSLVAFFKRSVSRGFTLTELLVSISVMAIILGITTSGGPQAIMRLTLADNAYKAELLIREAQLQGSAINSMNDMFGGAGVFVDLATSSQAVKFRDKVVIDIKKPISIGNGIYDQNSGEFDSVIKTINRHRVGKICVATGTGPFVCNDEMSPAIQNLTVSFSRPKQTAHIFVNNATTTEYSTACIQFDSLRTPTKGYVRSILVYRSGMITKKMDTCK